MSNATRYCREISNAFDLVAVYLPGTKIDIGDIIQFNKKNLVNSTSSIFKKLSSLKKLRIKYDIEENNSEADFTYSSKGSVKVKTEIRANNIIDTNVSFKSEGAVYFNAVNCKIFDVKEFNEIKKSLHEKCTTDESGLYVVTKLIIAEKAIIMQSSNKDAELCFNVDKHAIKQLADVGFNISSCNNQSLLIDSKNNVTILMDLYQIRVSKSKESNKNHNGSSRSEKVARKVADSSHIKSTNERKAVIRKSMASSNIRAKKFSKSEVPKHRVALYKMNPNKIYGK